jgi:four helix bundle protein
MSLAKKIRVLCKEMTKEDCWSVGNQLLRSSLSVPSNIVESSVAREALELASHKLPVKCAVISKE